MKILKNSGFDTEPIKYDIAFCQRTYGKKLYEISSSLLPKEYPNYPIIGKGQHTYFRELMKLDHDWVVNIDEDAFLYNFKPILDIIEYMSKKGYAYSGITEASINIRKKFSQVLPNAFFNIFHVKKIREKYSDQLWFDIFNTFKRKQEGRRSEGYYPFFYWLNANDFRYLSLNHESDSSITILKGLNNETVLKHAWYARHWKSRKHFWRYDKIFREIGINI